MSFAPGTCLGPHEILAPIGAGGMGELYRARDARLEPSGAIKVLPPHLSQSEGIRQRLWPLPPVEREKTSPVGCGELLAHPAGAADENWIAFSSGSGRGAERKQ